MDQVNILSISGGGIRGLITLYQLQELQSKLRRPLQSYFDYIGGTSTGGIIAAMLAFNYTIDDIIHFYKEHGPKIFESKTFRFGVLRPKYSDKYFNGIIQEIFGDKYISQASVNLVIPSYNLTDNTKVIFKSYSGEDQNMFDVVRSTASAQSYFKPHKIDGKVFIDGGMVINNPSQLLFTEALYAKRLNKSAKINTVSFGTGRKDTDIKVKGNGGGAIFWAKPTVEVLLNEQSRTTDYFLNRIHSTLSIGKYFNVEPQIEFSSARIDDASERNMKAMEIDGMNSATLHAKLLEKIAKTIEYGSR